MLSSSVTDVINAPGSRKGKEPLLFISAKMYVCLDLNIGMHTDAGGGKYNLH